MRDNNLLLLYSKPENDYPVAITVGGNVIDDRLDFNPQYVIIKMNLL